LFGRIVLVKLVSRVVLFFVDSSADLLGAMIRNARLERYPYLLVVGLKEAETGTVGVRSRDAGELGPMPVDAFADKLEAESRPPSLSASIAS
jgi:threonyl-tRNA synthetase